MAYMITDGKPSITTIDRFLGLNLNETGETTLQLGEASYIKNFRITKDFKLDKMYGYETIYGSAGVNPIRANWVGKLGSADVNVYVVNGKVYNKGTQLGTITDGVTSIYEFNKVLYFINGTDFKYWNGTNYGDVSGYIPLIKISCTPAGVGEDYEPINLINNYRKVSFSADGTSTTFVLPEKGIANVTAKVNGTTTSVTVSSDNGTATFSTAPAQGTDNVVIQYQKSNVAASVKQNITKNKYFQKYGLANDTRVFLYGNSSAPNRIYYSDLGNGVPNPEYFPANNFIDVGSSNEEITDISRQYDRLIISKAKETYYMTYDQITDTTNQTIITFPVYPLNASHGMVARAKGQVLDNYITTLDDSGIVQWVSTNTKDERNAVVISERIDRWLKEKDLSQAVTLDYQEDKEYWVAVGNEVMIYNYGNSTFYMEKFPVSVATLTSYNGVIFMGTATGLLVEFDKDHTTFDGAAIHAEWRSGQYDFEREYKRKTMRLIWITLKPWWKTSLKINYFSDRDTGTSEKEITSNCFTYRNWNYAEFSYNTITPIKPFKIKLKAKKFAFLKLTITNDKTDDRLTVNSISIQKSYGGFVK